jgi:microcystin-dependent protein
MSNFINLMDLIYPIGSVYETFENASPAEMFGGTWVQIKTFLYGSTSAGSTGGESTHTLTISEMPAHHHTDGTRVAWYNDTGSGLSTSWSSSANLRVDSATITTSNTGGGQAHNNLPPYTTCFIWRRTA